MRAAHEITNALIDGGNIDTLTTFYHRGYTILCRDTEGKDLILQEEENPDDYGSTCVYNR